MRAAKLAQDTEHQLRSIVSTFTLFFAVASYTLFTFFLVATPFTTLIAVTLRIVLVLGTFLCSAHELHAQTPAWGRVITADQDGQGRATMLASAVDGSGNVYITGGFVGTIRLGSLSLTSAGEIDVYVAKWSPATNTFVWAQRAGGLGNEVPVTLKCQGSNIYVAGLFEGATSLFGATTLVKTVPSYNAYDDDLFVAKLTDAGSTGSFTWAKSIGGDRTEILTSMAVSGSDVYVAGQFPSTTLQAGTTILTNTSPYNGDAFVTKLTDAGNTATFAWTQQIGTTEQDVLTGIAASGSNVYLTGEFLGVQMVLGNITLSNSSWQYRGVPDVYIAKLTDTGGSPTFVWARQAGGTDFDKSGQIAVNNDNVYVSGHFSSSTMNFGRLALVNTSTTYYENPDIFLTKLTDTGQNADYVWVTRIGGQSGEVPKALEVSGQNLYVGGIFSHLYYVPLPTPFYFGTTRLDAVGSNDLFVGKITDTGLTPSFGWVLSGGGQEPDNVTSLSVYNDKVYVTGSAITPARLGTFVFPGPDFYQISFLAPLFDTQVLNSPVASALTGVELYPNPARQHATVFVPFTHGASQVSLSLTDAVGRVVRSYSAALPSQGLHQQIELATLPAGLYLLRVQAGESRTIRHLVVE